MTSNPFDRVAKSSGPNADPNVESHTRSDVDQSINSLHHTLGRSPNQAAPGDHVHHTISPDPPGDTANSPGDTWEQHSATDPTIIIGRWRGEGNRTWVQEKLGSSTVSLKLSDLTADSITGAYIKTSNDWYRIELIDNPGVQDEMRFIHPSIAHVNNAAMFIQNINGNPTIIIRGARGSNVPYDVDIRLWSNNTTLKRHIQILSDFIELGGQAGAKTTVRDLEILGSVSGGGLRDIVHWGQTVDIPSLPAHSTTNVYITAAEDVQPDDMVIGMWRSTPEAGWIVTCHARHDVSGDIVIRATNVTGSAIDPVNRTFRFVRIR